MKERTKAMKTTGIIHNFSGKVFCKECGRYMRKKNSSKHEYLVCSNNRDGYDDCENKAAIRYDELEKIVLDAINKNKTYYDEEILEQEKSKNNQNRFASKIKSLEHQKKEILKKKEKTSNYLKSLYEDKVNGIINNEQFKELINNYNTEEDRYNNRIKAIDEEINYYKIKEESSKNNKEIFSKYKELTELNRVIVDEFIDKIYIGKLNEETKSRDIQIKWNFE